MKNRYIYHSKISEKKFRQILREYSLDSTATQTSVRTEVSRKTINKFYKLFRERIIKLCQKYSKLEGEVEIEVTLETVEGEYYEDVTIEVSIEDADGEQLVLPEKTSEFNIGKLTYRC